jgi:hypothetical protein
VDSCHLDSSLEDGNVSSTIIGSGDFNEDGKSDVLAGGADATSRMYPGHGTGGFLARKAVAGGGTSSLPSCADEPDEVR